MIGKKDIEKIIFESFDEINEELEDNEKLKKTSKTSIFGSMSSLDSIDLVNLIVLIEQRLEDKLDLSISLSDDRAISQKNSPFRDVETLVNYIILLVNE